LREVSETLATDAYETNGFKGLFHHPYMQAAVLIELAAEKFEAHSNQLLMEQAAAEQHAAVVEEFCEDEEYFDD